MSKAFTKENDGDQDVDLEIPEQVVPAGHKNYSTPNGAKRLQEELRTLMYKTRPEVVQVVSWAAGNGDRSENGDYIYGKKRLREIDRRVQFLSKRIESLEIVDPLKVACAEIRFGATVTVCDEDDKVKTYAIVGVDEADLSKGRISWIAPLATALMKAKEGDLVQFRSPKGLQEIEVVKIEYKEID